MKNPFPQGIATGSAFCNRTQERTSLGEMLINGQHAWLQAPRRHGKTSLIARVLSDLKKKHKTKTITISLDLLMTSKPEDASDLILAAVANALSDIPPKLESAYKSILNALKNFKPEITINPTGPSIKLTRSITVSSLGEALLGLDKLAGKYKKRIVFVLDEFQRLAEIDTGHSVEAAIRHAVERVNNITFVFSGSNRHLLIQAFENSKRPLFQLCRRFNINRIEASQYKTFIAKAAKKNPQWKKPLKEEVIDEILSLSECHPAYVNLLCSRLFERPSPPTSSRTRKTWHDVVAESEDYLKAEVTHLSGNQRRLLIALAVKPTRQPNSATYSRYCGVPGGSIRQALTKLISEDLIEKREHTYRVIDPALVFFLYRYKSLLAEDE